MNFILLDMVWPALYVSETFWRFWFLVIGTIVIELFVIKYFLKFSWTKSFVVSIIGNLVSGIVGTFVMVWTMLFWHLLADRIFQGTFNIANWVATYILMCLGSVFIETLTIKIIYKEKIRRLFLPMLTGNFLSYVFIAFVMHTKTDKDQDEVRTEVIKYLPNKQEFILLDSSKMRIDTCTIQISYDKNGNRLNESKATGYSFYIPFNQEPDSNFQFEFKVVGEELNSGINKNSKNIHFKELNDEYKIILEQKNPDTAFGWIKPITTDSLIFSRLRINK